ncbi:MAG: PAS domain S-box protein, partial [Rhodospirillaceae bacterium]
PLTRPMPFFSVPLPGVSSANAEQGGVPRVLIISAAEGERLSRIMAFGQLFSTGETYAFSEDGLMLSASRFGDQLVEMGLIRSPGDEVLNLRVADPEVDLTTGAQSPLAPEDRTLTKMVQSALRDGSGFDVDGTGYRDYRGVPVFGAWQWIASSQIGITTEVDVAEALGPYQETRLILLSLVGGVVAIGLGLTGVSIWTGRSASRNLWVANQELEQRVEERAQDAVTSERRMRAIIDNAVDGIITIDDQGTVEDFSAAAGQIFGYTPQEVIGQNIKMLMAPEIAREHDGYLSAYRAGGRPHVVGKNREVTGRKKDGTTFPMDLAVGEILIEGRKTFTGIVRDISARKKAGEALTLSEERTRLILESVGEGVFGVDLDGRITFVNQSAEKLLGFLAREMIGQKAHPLFHHHRRDGSVYPVHDCWMFKSFTEGESYRIDNEVLWRKDRKPLEVEYFATPIRKDGAIVGAVVSFSDISKRRDAERKLKQAFRLSQKTLREMDAVLEAIDYGICFMDKDLRVRVMNQAFMTQWHFDPDVLAAKPTMEELIRRNRYNGLYYLADPSDDDA